jgi:hypothetical protein
MIEKREQEWLYKRINSLKNRSNKTVAIALFLGLIFPNFINSQENNLNNYNVVWDKSSNNSMESMPLNGHSIGCNVWVEDGAVLFYAAQSGAFDENNESLKLGRFRINLSPNPFLEGATFKQELKLKEGYVQITALHPKSGTTTVKLWVETNRPVIHVDVESNNEIKMDVAYESWRWQDVVLETEKVAGVKGRRASLFDYDNYLMDLVKYGDEIHAENKGLYFYHNNANKFTAFDFVVKQQELTEVKNQLDNPLKNLISGGFLVGENLKFDKNSTGTYFNTPFKAWHFTSLKTSKKHHFNVYTNVEQHENPSLWKSSIQQLVNEKKSEEQLFKNNLAWWKDFWNRSYIQINPNTKNKTTDLAWIVGRNYNLFRYQLGGNTYGRMPTKFNGGNLTVDAGYVNEAFPYGPDFRRWGGGSFTAQNQRLVYWPMLKSGDFEAMIPQFEFYRKALNNAIARTKVYWNHGGCSFTEQMQQSGFPIASHYGFTENGFWNTKRPLNYEKGEQVNTFVKTLYQGELEFAFMILEYHKYSGHDISAYIPFIYNCIYFFDQHYQYTNEQKTGNKFDANGKLVLFPTTPGENSPNSTNAIDVIAGLKAVVGAALELPSGVFPDSCRTYFKEVKPRIPDFELYKHNEAGKSFTLLRESKEDTAWHSGFMPSLYPLFPYRLIHSEMPEFEYIQNVWKYKMKEDNKQNYASWRPGVFMGANLQLTDYAKSQILKKLGNSGKRYPTFWGPGHDWTPDHNWGGSGMIGLQEMLLQEKNGKIHLFPAWPQDWDVDFKLYASHGTIIEALWKNGKVTDLKVTPKERKKDIVIDNQK